MDLELKAHWENIYRTRQPHQVSWTQSIPTPSLELISELNLPRNASIIDIGGGDSRLADHLLAEGYTDISVLDLSGIAMERAKIRIGTDANRVKWIESDVMEFRPSRKYVLWHDRAMLHFLVDSPRLETYCEMVREHVTGSLIVGAFSTEGPERCSNLPVRRFDEDSLGRLFEPYGFAVKDLRRHKHFTPSGVYQNFIFGRFEKVK